jgi:hypothetical protein
MPKITVQCRRYGLDGYRGNYKNSPYHLYKPNNPTSRANAKARAETDYKEAQHHRRPELSLFSRLLGSI